MPAESVPNISHTQAPATALQDLAEAHILLHLCEHPTAEMEFGAVAACAVMVYGVEAWEDAEREVRMRLAWGEVEDRSDGINAGGDTIAEEDVRQELHRGQEELPAVQAREFMVRAIDSIRAWDGEVARRIVGALGAVSQLMSQRSEGWTCLIS